MQINEDRVRDRIFSKENVGGREMKKRNRFVAAMMSGALMVSTILAAAPMTALARETTSIHSLTVNYQEQAAGVETDQVIRFGWKMSSEEQGKEQVSYKINVYQDSEKGKLVWTSGEVKSAKSAGIAFQADEMNLKDETKYTWVVTVTSQDGGTYQSDAGSFITGTDMNDASWIIPEQNENAVSLLRTEQELKGQVESAYLYISSLGIYTAYIDGQEVKVNSSCDDIFNPGWTDYKYYTNYQTYDVTDYIQDSTVTVGVELGKGWYAGRIGETGSYGAVFGPDDEKCEMGLIAKLVVNYSDGSRQYIRTNQDDWKSSAYSPVTENDFFDGETYDARIADEIRGWNDDGYLAASAEDINNAWAGVTEGSYKGDLRSGTGAAARIADEYDRYPVRAYTYKEEEMISAEDAGNDYGTVREHEEDTDRAISLKKGENLIIDFGQNGSGAVELTVEGKEGTAVTIDHSEMLNDGRKNSTLESGGSDGPSGTLYKKAITNANVTDKYLLSGKGAETFLPKFTFRGFQYAEITADQDITIKGIKAKVYTSVGDQTGTIETNNRDINKLFSNTLWSQKSNYLSIPTDCPQRGERAGWTGDAQLFAATGVYNYDVFTFLESYNDIMQEHAKNNGDAYGAIMPTSFVGFFATMISSGWSDAGIIIPWVLYQQTGDTTLIEEYYGQMDAYMSVVNQKGYGPMFGDWLAFSGASTPYLNAVYQIYCTSLMEKMADVLGRDADASKYRDRYSVLKKAFMEKYVDEDGNVLSSTADDVTVSNHGYPVVDNAQTALLWALKLGLYRENAQRDIMIASLLKNVKNEGGSVRPDYEENTLSVGFLGVNVILPVLTEIGAADVAYDLLLQDALPSWLYSVKNGATTIWERWNSYSTENSFGDSGMNSFNHYSYGACVEWMFKYMGGITMDEENPGFQDIILQPTVDESGRITFVNSSYNSVYGNIVSNWQAESGKMSVYHAEIPANTRAVLYLEVSEGVARKLAGTQGVTFVGMTTRNEKQTAQFELVSGSYDFRDFKENQVQEQDVKVSQVSLNKASHRLFIKDTMQLSVSVNPANASDKSVAWSSSNATVAKVDGNGKVMAMKAGTAIITAAAKDGSGKKAECKVTVVKPTVKLNVKSARLQVKKTTKAIKASGLKSGDSIRKWTSSKKSVATVDKNGKIRAKKAGTTTIKVITKKGAAASMRLTVTKKAVKTTGIRASVKKVTMRKGKTYQLVVTRKPVTATEKITYKSSKKSVATVTGKGMIRGRKKGRATITVKTSNGKKCMVKVIVK